MDLSFYFFNNHSSDLVGFHDALQFREAQSTPRLSAHTHTHHATGRHIANSHAPRANGPAENISQTHTHAHTDLRLVYESDSQNHINTNAHVFLFSLVLTCYNSVRQQHTRATSDSSLTRARTSTL